jgi:hypothetical protein
MRIIGRRVAIGLVAFLQAGAVGAQVTAPGVPIEWTLTRDRATEVLDVLEFEGTTEHKNSADTRGVPVLVLIGVAVLPSLVESLIALYRDLEGGGMIIDATGEELQIRTDGSLPYGVLVVRDAEGVEVKSYRSTPEAADLAEVIAALAKTVAPGP